MSITENIEKIANTLPAHVRLIAVSKTKPVEAIEEAYRWGQRAFGENKVQELVKKQGLLPKDIEWHLIGHLQTNKVKEVVPVVTLIHAVDSLKLLSVINREANRVGRIIDCLLQFHIAEESTKFGLSEAEAIQLLESDIYREMQYIRITGVMGMATYTEDEGQIRREFHRLREIYEKLKRDYFPTEVSFREISMGMSGDYPIAIEEGSTMVRIGSSIFGERDYNKPE